MPSGITTRITRLWGFGGNNVWAVGERGVALNYTYTGMPSTPTPATPTRSRSRSPASPRSSSPTKLWTIDDLGGWKAVDADLFAKDTGKIAVIYDQATS